MESISTLLTSLMALSLAILVYMLGKDVEKTRKKPFSEIEFAGKQYLCVDTNEKHLGTRIIALLQQIKGHQEGVVLEKNEPIIALVPMEEFLRLKGLEEYLDDIAIAKLIETRLANRNRAKTHPLKDFDAFRKTIYQEEEEKQVDNKQLMQE
ncbi:MAG: hypothetical protein PHX65_04830 [Sulfurimonas sp.]|nr:hypothetical protein [Sulfurimonas sp.]